MKRSSLFLAVCFLLLAVGAFWLVSRQAADRTRPQLRTADHLASAQPANLSVPVIAPASPEAGSPATASPSSGLSAPVPVVGVPPSQLAIAPDDAADEGPVTATAALRRQSGETLPLKSIEGLFKQVLLDPVETVQISLDLARFDQTKPVRLVANNGGSINRRLGPTVIDPATAGPRVDFTFGVGATRGIYNVEVLQGTRTELFDFWVGPLPPRGEAGPPREFNGDANPQPAS